MDRFRLGLIVIGVVAVAILAGGWFVGIQPQLDRIAAAASQTASIRQVNDAQQQRNAALEADNANLSGYQSQLAAEQAQMPATRSQQDLVDQIGAAATAAGVHIQALDFDAPSAYAAPAGVPVALPVQQLVAIPISITAAGDRPQLEAFAAALQASTRIVTISASEFTGPEDDRLVLAGTTWILLAPAT